MLTLTIYLIVIREVPKLPREVLANAFALRTEIMRQTLREIEHWVAPTVLSLCHAYPVPMSFAGIKNDLRKDQSHYVMVFAAEEINQFTIQPDRGSFDADQYISILPLVTIFYHISLQVLFHFILGSSALRSKYLYT